MAMLHPSYEKDMAQLSVIPAKLELSTRVRIKGTMLANGRRCIVDFLPPISRHATNGNILFHLSLHANNNVVLNSFTKQCWGAEVKSGTSTFGVNRKFEILIDVRKDSFEISVNGQRLTPFKLRYPMEYVEMIRVTGHVEIESVVVEGKKKFGLH